MAVAGISLLIAFGFKRWDGKTASIVIVPGSRIKGDKPSKMLKRRLNAAKSILEKHKDAICVVSGGQGNDEEFTEAEVMKKYLVSKDISEDRIFTEDKSRNTKENFLFSKKLLDNIGAKGETVVTTDMFHCFRCLLYAKRAGIQALAFPCKTPASSLLFHWVREILAIIKAAFGF